MPDGRRTDRVFDGETILIGRSSRADLSLPDRALSREHARLLHREDGWLVEDLESRNGTFVNGRQVREPTRLRPGDAIGVGSVTLTLATAGTAEVAEDTGHPSAHTVLRPASELLGGQAPPAEGASTDSGALRRYVERLQVLNEVHQALARAIELDALFELILDRVFDHLQPEQGAVFLTDDQGSYSCAASRSVTGTGDCFVFSRSLAREVVEKGMAALVLDMAEDARFKEARSLLGVGVRSLMAAPLADPEGAIGLIVLCSKAAIRRFNEDDLALLVSLASVAVLRIRNVALAEEAAERRRLAEEVALARRIQVALLPERLPEVVGWELHGGNVPSRGVSGDYYEVTSRCADRECVLHVIDVSGKGVAASLLTASVEALSVAPIEDGLDPAEIYTRVSRLLFQRTPPERYATGFLAVLDRTTGVLRYSNAGHCPALVVRREGALEWLGATGPPLGLLPGSRHAGGKVALEPGDLVAVYTDGLTEAADAEEEEYGRGRLAEVFRQHRGEPLAAIASAVEADLDRFVGDVPYADDRTLVLLRRHPA